MTTSFFVNTKQPRVEVTISAETVHTVLMTMALLTARDARAEVEPWLIETANRLSPEQKKRNHLVFAGLGPALLPETDYPDFPAYLAAINTISADTLRARIEPHAKGKPADSVDADLQAEVQQLLTQPEEMKTLMVDHLQAMWEAYLAPEWQKREANLQSMLTLLNAREFAKESAVETIRAFIRRDIPDEISLQLAGIKSIIFVPTPHIRLHANRFGHDDTIWVFVLADFWSLPLREEPIKRSEALRPLRALADDTRLQILELLAAHNQLLAQEIIARIDVGQSTVSRHLKQLVAAQIVIEERGPDANKLYSLNPKAIDSLYYTLKTLLSTENAHTVLNDVRLTLSPELRRFLDRDGKVTTWPRKYKDKLVILHYLIDKFEVGQDYSEADVNELLAEWHTNNDAATLRRALFDAGLLQREANGARYWRAA